MRMVELGSVCEIKNGYAFKSSEFKKSGTPLIRISSFDNGAVYFDDKTVYVDSSYLKTKSGFKVEKGDVLIALSGATTGKYGIYTGDEPSLLNQRIGLLKSGASEQMNDKFFYYYLSVLKSEILRNAGGAAQPNISTKSISELKIPLPPLDQQKKIASILDAADNYRQKTKALIEKYDELTQSLFLDMFGDPVSNPKGWEKVKLGKISHMKAGKFVKASGIKSEKNLKLYSCYGGNGLRGYVESFTHEGEFLLIGRQGALCGNIKRVNGKFHATEHAIVCSPTMKYESLWLYHMLVMINLNKYATGAAQPGLNVGTLVDLEVMFASYNLQNQFAERVQAIEAQKAQAQDSLAQAEDLFNSLLQRAFKGELV